MSFFRLVPLLLLTVLPAMAADDPAPAGAPVAPSSPAASSPAPEPLQAVLASLSQDPLFGTAAVSVQVVDAATGAPVYAWGDDRALTPASTMKLLTAATALHALGPTWRFPTWIMKTGDIDDKGVLTGSLYVKGQGDPTMVVERLWRLAADLHLMGISEVKGDVVFDAAYFEDTTMVPGWDKDEDLASAASYYSALGALSVNYNIATIVMRPGTKAGEATTAVFDTPTAVVEVDNHVTTGRARSKTWIKLERKLDEETGTHSTYTLTGNIAVDDGIQHLYPTLADPLGNYMGALQGVMAQQGIKVKGKYKAGPTPSDAQLFHTVWSEPLTDVLADMNKQSNNFMAEQILRAVGAEKVGLPGTTAKGLSVVQSYLGQLGVQESAFKLVNGSGLSRQVLVPPSLVNHVLVDMHNSVELGPEFLQTLAVGGRDGTLRWKFRQDALAGRVRGKTGSLNGVRALAGYVQATDGRTFAFTFLVNDIDGAGGRAWKAYDALVAALAGVGADLADGAEEAEAP
jgi:D-alanyl-D-alanine carboxypeptidase/D-alanyl-D-alanine-endopeptidase (penicillin-binding protein 4)